jgi:PST family polysaccharide transporter
MRISTYYMLLSNCFDCLLFKLAVAKKIIRKPFFEFFIKDITRFYLGVTIVYFTRFFIVKLLLRRNFTSDHFILLAISRDVLKVASLILGYQFLQNLQWLLLSLNYYLFRSFTYQVYFSLNLWSRRDCNGACLDVFRILISACGLF